MRILTRAEREARLVMLLRGLTLHGCVAEERVWHAHGIRDVIHVGCPHIADSCARETARSVTLFSDLDSDSVVRVHMNMRVSLCATCRRERRKERSTKREYCCNTLNTFGSTRSRKTRDLYSFTLLSRSTFRYPAPLNSRESIPRNEP